MAVWKWEILLCGASFNGKSREFIARETMHQVLAPTHHSLLWSRGPPWWQQRSSHRRSPPRRWCSCSPGAGSVQGNIELLYWDSNSVSVLMVELLICKQSPFTNLMKFKQPVSMVLPEQPTGCTKGFNLPKRINPTSRGSTWSNTSIATPWRLWPFLPSLWQGQRENCNCISQLGLSWGWNVPPRIARHGSVPQEKGLGERANEDFF